MFLHTFKRECGGCNAQQKQRKDIKKKEERICNVTMDEKGKKGNEIKGGGT